MTIFYDHLLRNSHATRRDFVRVGGLTGLGLSLFGGSSLRALAGASGMGHAKSCILLWLNGGPSHLETFDMKPNTPSEVRGPFQPIKTNVPGMEVSELLPNTAAIADKIAIIRSVTR